MFTNPTFIIIAGHQGDGDTGGSSGLEKQLTGKLADEYVKGITAAGYKAIRIPDGIEGGLDAASRALASACSRTSGNLIVLDIHFEGASAPGVFAIYPRSDGLGTAIQVSGQENDTQGSNPLDQSFGIAISRAISTATGLPLRSTGVVSPGLMGEHQTGVAGTYKARLATFAYTAPFQPRAIRLVVEHGSLPTADRSVILEESFNRKVVGAVVGVVKEMFPRAGARPVYGKPAEFPKSNGRDHGNFRAIVRYVTAGPTGAALRAFGSPMAVEVGARVKPGKEVRVIFKAGSWWITSRGARVHEDEIVEKVEFTK